MDVLKETFIDVTHEDNQIWKHIFCLDIKNGCVQHRNAEKVGISI